MDNFSAHTAAIELAPPPPNVRLESLPKNSTSKYQPMDQGIIQNFKNSYRRQWLQFCVAAYAKQEDPIKKVTLYNTLRWTAAAWRGNVTRTTICNCWAKSTILERSSAGEDPTPPQELSELLAEVQLLAGVGEDARDLHNFLHPEGEDEEPEQQVNIQEIIEYHTGKTGLEAVPEEDDEPEPLPSLTEAIKALSIVQRFVETQEDSSIEQVSSLRQLERSLNLQSIQKRRQTTLDSYFS